MNLLSIKLNAFELPDGSKINELEALVNKVKEAKKDNPNFQYKLEREEILKSDNSCLHCPKHLLLTEQINKVMEKWAHDPTRDLGNEVPVKINRLKFLYYTLALHDQNGKRGCQRFMDITPDLKPTKFDGQFKLIAEDVLRFRDVSEIQYMNPGLDEVVYYYRGEGADQDIVVQAILTKDGGKFRSFRYTPTEKEKNPYNLPSMENDHEDPKALGQKNSSGLKISGVETRDPPSSGLIGTDKMGLKFKAEVEKRNKFIPKNVHLIEAHLDHEIAAGLKVKASSDTSLKGNAAKFALKGEGGNDLVLIDIDTSLSGKTQHRVSVPYSLRMLEESRVEVKGKVQHETEAQILTMSITDQSIELVRSEYRKNTSNGASSYVIARDFQINPREALSLQYVKGEDQKKYASLKHAKSLKDNVTLVLDVRVGEDKKASLFYQVNAKF